MNEQVSGRGLLQCDSKCATVAHKHTALYTQAQACMYTHTYTLTDIHMPEGQRGSSQTNSRWPQLPSPPFLIHSCTPVFSDLYLLHTHWVHGSAPGPGRTPLTTKGQPHLGEMQAPGLVTSRRRPGREAGEAACQPAGGRRAAERPLLAAACGHTWLNRDNGGCYSSPASFPQAQPQVPECPEPLPTPENRLSWEQPEGSSRGLLRDGRDAEGVWWPWGMKL